jgi:hypothetical protein
MPGGPLLPEKIGPEREWPARLTSMPGAPTTIPAALAQKTSPVSRTDVVTVSPQAKLWVLTVLSAPQPGPPRCCASRAQRR